MHEQINQLGLDVDKVLWKVVVCRERVLIHRDVYALDGLECPTRLCQPCAHRQAQMVVSSKEVGLGNRHIARMALLERVPVPAQMRIVVRASLLANPVKERLHEISLEHLGTVAEGIRVETDVTALQRQVFVLVAE